MAKILVVDDDSSMTDMLRECLRREAHDIVVCLDPTMAEQTALEVKPDLAIIDYQMPRKNGVELLADLRARKETRALPVIFLSATNTLRFAIQIPAERHMRFLTKPLNMSILIATVGEMLNPESWSAHP